MAHYGQIVEFILCTKIALFLEFQVDSLRKSILNGLKTGFSWHITRKCGCTKIALFLQKIELFLKKSTKIGVIQHFWPEFRHITGTLWQVTHETSLHKNCTFFGKSARFLKKPYIKSVKNRLFVAHYRFELA